jgi:hypothetical protein
MIEMVCDMESMPDMKILFPFTWLVRLLPESRQVVPLTKAFIFAGHGLHLGPPQSISLSLLFNIPSSQLGKSDTAVSTIKHAEFKVNKNNAVTTQNLMVFFSFVALAKLIKLNSFHSGCYAN